MTRTTRMTLGLRAMVGFVFATALATGCAKLPVPQLGPIYDRAAMAHDPMRNPVVVIPGILGSRLTDTQTQRGVWGAFGGSSANPEKPDGARLVAHPMQRGSALATLRDGVVPDGALDRLEVDLFGVPVRLDAYRQILGTLGVGGYRDEALGVSGAIDYGDDHYTCFQFDYDWRRDNVENAQRLHAFLVEKRAYVQEQLAERYGIEAHDVRFDIVAHSMGGLITRYMLRYGDADLPADGSVPELTWAGRDLVEHAILVGTPNAGSAEALQQLVDGAEFAFFLPRYEPAVLGTMPSIYQLLPRPRHRCVFDGGDRENVIDVLDPAVWEERGWGLASPKQARMLEYLLPDERDPALRRAIALDHQAKCLRRARAFFAALDTPASSPEGLTLSIIAGDAVKTDALLSVDGRQRVRVVETGPGDGTVLRSSALMDEREAGEWGRQLVTPIPWRHVLFLFTDHIGLTKDPAFTDNVLYQLLEAPR